MFAGAAQQSAVVQRLEWVAIWREQLVKRSHLPLPNSGVDKEMIGMRKLYASVSALIILICLGITLAALLDRLFGLEWGYGKSDYKYGLVIVVFGIVLRFIGMRIVDWTIRTSNLR